LGRPDAYRADLELLAPPDEPFEEPGLYEQPEPERYVEHNIYTAEPPGQRIVEGDKINRFGRYHRVLEANRSSITTDGGGSLHLLLQPLQDDEPVEGKEPFWVKEPW
jgi:hypothetical protein